MKLCSNHIQIAKQSYTNAPQVVINMLWEGSVIYMYMYVYNAHVYMYSSCALGDFHFYI